MFVVLASTLHGDFSDMSIGQASGTAFFTGLACTPDSTVALGTDFDVQVVISSPSSAASFPGDGGASNSETASSLQVAAAGNAAVSGVNLCVVGSFAMGNINAMDGGSFSPSSGCSLLHLHSEVAPLECSEPAKLVMVELHSATTKGSSNVGVTTQGAVASGGHTQTKSQEEEFVHCKQLEIWFT